MMYGTFAQYIRLDQPPDAFLSIRSAAAPPMTLRRIAAAANVNPDLAPTLA
jgi:hypothetical protein